jgi:hypothetical protein
MSFAELDELEVISARIDELQERHWFAEKLGYRKNARQLAQELLDAQARRKQLVDRIMARPSDAA